MWFGNFCIVVSQPNAKYKPKEFSFSCLIHTVISYSFV